MKLVRKFRDNVSSLNFLTTLNATTASTASKTAECEKSVATECESNGAVETERKQHVEIDGLLTCEENSQTVNQKNCRKYDDDDDDDKDDGNNLTYQKSNDERTQNQTRLLSLSHLNKLFREYIRNTEDTKGTEGTDTVDPDTENREKLLQLLPLFCKVFGTQATTPANDEIRQQFSEAPRFCEELVKLFGTEVRKRASNRKIETASLNLLNFLKIYENSSTKTPNYGWLCLSSFYILAFNNPIFVQIMIDNSLPSLLVKCLYLFLDLPNLEQRLPESQELQSKNTICDKRNELNCDSIGNVVESDRDTNETHDFDLFRKTFHHLLLKLCENGRAAEDLIASDALILVFYAMTTCCRPENVVWRQQAVDILVANSCNGLTPAVINYIHNKKAMSICIRNLKYLLDIDVLEISTMLVSLFAFLKESCNVSPVLLDDFKVSKGYLFLEEYLLCFETKFHDDESQVHNKMRETVEQIGRLVTYGYAENVAIIEMNTLSATNVSSSTSASFMYKLPDFRIPKPCNDRTSVRNTNAFEVLQTVFVRTRSVYLSCVLIESIVTVISGGDRANYFMLEQQRPLAHLIECADRKPNEVQIQIFALLEFLVFDLKFIPFKEFIAIVIYLRTRVFENPKCGHICLNSLTSIIATDQIFKKIFREAGLIEVCLNCLEFVSKGEHKHESYMNKNDGKTNEQEWNQFVTVIFDCLRLLLEDCSENCDIFNKYAGPDLLRYFLRTEMFRIATLEVFHELIVMNRNENELIFLLNSLNNSFSPIVDIETTTGCIFNVSNVSNVSPSIAIKNQILICLISCLKRSHKCRIAFRKNDGFLSVLNTLIALDSYLNETTISREIVIVLRNVFRTISAAIKNEPGNAKFFTSNFCATNNLRDTLACLKCFVETNFDDDDDDDADKYEYFEEIFATIDPKNFRTTISHSQVVICVIFRLLFDLFTDRFKSIPYESLRSLLAPGALNKQFRVIDLHNHANNEKISDFLIVHSAIVTQLFRLLMNVWRGWKRNKSSANIPYLIVFLSQKLRNLLESERNQQIMCEENFVRELIDNFGLCDSNDPNSPLPVLLIEPETTSNRTHLITHEKEERKNADADVDADVDENSYNSYSHNSDSRTTTTTTVANSFHGIYQWIFERCGAHSLQPNDLREFFRINSPLLCSPLDETNAQTSGPVSLTLLKSLVSMVTPKRFVGDSTVNISAAFVEFNMANCDGFAALFLPSLAPQIQVSSNALTTAVNDSTTIFLGTGSGYANRVFPPQIGLTFATWIYIDRFSNSMTTTTRTSFISQTDSFDSQSHSQTQPHPIRLLSIFRTKPKLNRSKNANSTNDKDKKSNSNEPHVVFAIQLAVDLKSILISTLDLSVYDEYKLQYEKNGDFFARVSLPKTIGEKVWYHFAIVLQQRTVLKQSMLHVYLNGELVHSQPFQYICSSASSSATIISTTSTSTTANATATSTATATNASTLFAYIGTPDIWRKSIDLCWRQGPCFLCEESIASASIMILARLGPSYIGSLQAIDPLSSSYAASSLTISNSVATSTISLASEEKISFALNPAVCSEFTLGKIKKIFSRLDSKAIQKHLNRNDNLTVVKILPNSALHLPGPNRSLGAVLIGGRLTVCNCRQFRPQPPAITLNSIGGSSILFGLVAFASDSDCLYAAIKSLVYVCESNILIRKEMQSQIFFATFAMLLKQKSNLLNSSILSLVFSLIRCCGEGTVAIASVSKTSDRKKKWRSRSGNECDVSKSSVSGSGDSNDFNDNYFNDDENILSTTTNQLAFQYLICDFEIWHGSIDLLRSLFEYIYEVLVGNRQYENRRKNLEILRSMRICEKILYLLSQMTLTTPSLFTTITENYAPIFRLLQLLLGTDPQSADWQNFGRFTISLIRRDNNNSNNSEVFLLENLLKILQNLLKTKAGNVNVLICEELSESLGFDWILQFFYAPHCFHLAFECFLTLMSNGNYYVRFRDSLMNQMRLVARTTVTASTTTTTSNNSGSQWWKLNGAFSSTVSQSSKNSNDNQRLTSANAADTSSSTITLTNFELLEFLLIENRCDFRFLPYLVSLMIGKRLLDMESNYLVQNLHFNNVLKCLSDNSNRTGIDSGSYQLKICPEAVEIYFVLIRYLLADHHEEKSVELIQLLFGFYQNFGEFTKFFQTTTIVMNLAKILLPLKPHPHSISDNLIQNSQAINFLKIILIDSLSLPIINLTKKYQPILDMILNVTISNVVTVTEQQLPPTIGKKSIGELLANSKIDYSKFTKNYQALILTNIIDYFETINIAQIPLVPLDQSNSQNIPANIYYLNSRICDQLFAYRQHQHQHQQLLCPLRVLKYFLKIIDQLNNCEQFESHNFLQLQQQPLNRLILLLFHYRQLETKDNRNSANDNYNDYYERNLCEMFSMWSQLSLQFVQSNDTNFFACLVYCLLSIIGGRKIAIEDCEQVSQETSATWWLEINDFKIYSDNLKGMASKFWQKLYDLKATIVNEIFKIEKFPANDDAIIDDSLFVIGSHAWQTFVTNELKTLKLYWPWHVHYQKKWQDQLTMKRMENRQQHEQRSSKLNKMMSGGLGRLTSRRAHVAIAAVAATTTMTTAATTNKRKEQMIESGLTFSLLRHRIEQNIHLVRNQVRAEQMNYRIETECTQKYLMGMWREIEVDLLRERGVWGSNECSKFQKWSLDLSEGYSRMRKKLQRNTEFYDKYPMMIGERKKKSNEPAILKFRCVAASYDSSDYFAALKRYRIDSLNEVVSFASELETTIKPMEAQSQQFDSIVDDDSLVVNASTDDEASSEICEQQSLPSTTSPSLESNESNFPAIDDRIEADYKDTSNEVNNESLLNDDNKKTKKNIENRKKSEEDTDDDDDHDDDDDKKENDDDDENHSIMLNNRFLFGLLENNEKIAFIFRCLRVEGLDTYEALLVFGKEHCYIIDGFTILKNREIYDLDTIRSTKTDWRIRKLYEPIVPESSSTAAAAAAAAAATTVSINASKQSISERCGGSEIHGQEQNRRQQHSKKFAKIAYEDCREILKRRYLLQPMALEMFLCDGRNYLLAFARNCRNDAYQRLRSLTNCGSTSSLSLSSASISASSPSAAAAAASSTAAAVVSGLSLSLGSAAVSSSSAPLNDSFAAGVVVSGISGGSSSKLNPSVGINESTKVGGLSVGAVGSGGISNNFSKKGNIEHVSNLFSNLMMGSENVQNKWIKGEITNFQYLMHLNSLAGRSYNDLMQYPIFPWILSDYESDELDLTNANSFRDLKKPMGAQTPERLAQFCRRFSEWDDPYSETPPYHYGTHYSSAMIVCSYLVRLEPFTQQFLKLQGGHFDLADRMFHSVAEAWLSASQNNMADVKELIPEFFYLPDFLRNTNNFDFGIKQNGVRVHNVVLPPWSKNSAHEFVRLNRMALESEYVSQNLHHWIDLIFGYKQQGKNAVEACNVFHHLFYEGDAADIYNIQDPLKKLAAIGFINNFGQIPKQLFQRPHAARRRTAASARVTTKTVALSFRASIASSLSSSIDSIGGGGGGSGGGANDCNSSSSSNSYSNGGGNGSDSKNVNYITGNNFEKVLFFKSCDNLKPSTQPIKEVKGAVGQIVAIGSGNNRTSSSYASTSCSSTVPTFSVDYNKNAVLVVAENKCLLPATTTSSSSYNNKYISWGFADRSLRVSNYDNDRVVCVLESAPQCCDDITVCVCPSSKTVIAGTSGSYVSVYAYDTKRHQFILRKQLFSHRESVISLAANVHFNVFVSGSKDGTAIVWDLAKLTFIRQLTGHVTSVSAVAIQDNTANIATCSSTWLYVWDINGYRLARINTSSSDKDIRMQQILCVTFSCFNEWDNDNVIVTGSTDGVVKLWSIRMTKSNRNTNDNQNGKSNNDDDNDDDDDDYGINQETDEDNENDEDEDDAKISENRFRRRHHHHHQWRQILILRGHLTANTAYTRKDNTEPASITALAISKDHRFLFVGDARGRVYSWSVSFDISDHNRSTVSID